MKTNKFDLSYASAYLHSDRLNVYVYVRTDHAAHTATHTFTKTQSSGYVPDYVHAGGGREYTPEQVEHVKHFVSFFIKTIVDKAQSYLTEHSFVVANDGHVSLTMNERFEVTDFHYRA